MQRGGLLRVFVGIESPDTDTLVAMQKKQNTRRSLAESIHKIYEHGMFVIAGFIVGFDSEKGSVADGMVDCIEDAAFRSAWSGCSRACRTRSSRPGSRGRAACFP